MTVTNSNLNISQLSLQSLKEESFSDVPLTEPPKLGSQYGKKYVQRRAVSSSHIAQQMQQQIQMSPVGIVSSRSSSSIVGLGIRRPSDSIASADSPARKERPFSTYSSVSTSSDVSSAEEFNSRVSSLTSYTSSPFVSPVLPENQQQAHQKPSLSKSASVATASTMTNSTLSTPKKTPTGARQKIYPHGSAGGVKATSSPAVYNDLTPQQRFRLRRSQSKTSLKEIEKRYDAFDSDDDIGDDTLVWNVPIATGGAATFFANDSNCQSPKLVNKVLKSSKQKLQPSELPGRLKSTMSTPNLPMSPNLTKQPSFAQLSPLAKDISVYYDQTTQDYLKKELKERKSFSQVLPADVTDAQSHGFDDYQTLSNEKASYFTSTRPLWLPPKPEEEAKRHNKEVRAVLNSAAAADLQKKGLKLKQAQRDEWNIARFKRIASKDVLRSKNVKECGLMFFETSIPRDIEFELLQKICLKQLGGNITEAQLGDEYEVACKKVDSIDFTSKALEFQHATGRIIRNYPVFQDEVSIEFQTLQRCLKLNQVTEFEMLSFLTSKLILAEFSTKQCFVLMKFFNQIVLNDNFNLKYQSNLHSNSVLKRKLPSSFLKDDLHNLSFKFVLALLPQQIMLRMFNIFLAIPDYKLAYALLLTVCKDYYFGFNNMKELISSGVELDIGKVVDEEGFFEKLKENYKRF